MLLRVSLLALLMLPPLTSASVAHDAPANTTQRPTKGKSIVFNLICSGSALSAHCIPASLLSEEMSAGHQVLAHGG